MTSGRVIRRVAKRTYDQYAFVDYAVSSDNLNPINPTKLDTQVTEVTAAVKQKIINAYDKVKIETPKELFEPEVSPATLLSAIDNLIRNVKSNPLKGLLNNLGPGAPIDVALATIPNDTDFLNNPPQLDCDGVTDPTSLLTNNNETDTTTDTTGDTNKETDDEDSNNEDSDDWSSDSTNSASSNGDLGKSSTATIVYNKESLDEKEDTSSWPSTITKSEKTKSIAAAVPVYIVGGDNYEFKGWFYDNTYNSPVKNNKVVYDMQRDGVITLYAFFDLKDDSDNPDDQTTDDTNIAQPDDGNDCNLIELSFLKIILIIIIILKILIQVFVLVYNIMKAMADIAKDAQLCWINPPSLQSLISYIMQRLSAIIFQIVGMILLKIWAMLNLDCVSDNTMNTIDQINSALSGLLDAFGELESLALQMGQQGSSFASAWQGMIDQLKKDLDAQKEDLLHAYENIGTELGEMFKEYGNGMAEKFTNPRTYLELLPAEKQAKILNTIDSIENTKNTIKRTQQTINKLKTGKSTTIVNEIPKNVEVTSY